MTTSSELDGIILALTLVAMLLCVGMCCSCANSAKETAEHFEKKKADLITRLENAGSLSPEARRALIDEALAFRHPKKSLLIDSLKRGAALSTGATVKNSKVGKYWQAWVNETVIGRFFTQEVLIEPLEVLVFIMKNMTGVLGGLIVNSHTGGTPSMKFVTLLIATVALSALMSMLKFYASHYQTHFLQGRDYST